MRILPLRIAPQLSLFISAVVVLAVLAVGTLSVVNLQSGFKDYLQARDDEQLVRLVALLERRSQDDPQLQWLRQDPEALRNVMDEFNGRPARGQRPPPPSFLRSPPPQGAGGGNLGDRLIIRDLQGEQLVGRRHPPDRPRTACAIKVQGVEVAFAELITEPAPDGIDARFLQRQISRLVWVVVGTSVFALLAGWWFAGRWSRPLRSLQNATRDIARGKRLVTLEPTGALEIAQLMTDVNTMAMELDRLEKARRSWIAQISHELRTPLSVLRGEMEGIEDGARQPTRAVMASLRDEVLQLTRLVDDLHTLSVADMGGLRCVMVEGDAHACLWRVGQRFAAQAHQRSLTLTLPAQSGPAIPVRWDFGRIEQLLANLLTNSLRYTDAPGHINVDWRHDGRVLTLTVDDTAPGVSATDMQALFEPLFRADRARQRVVSDSTTTLGHGSGLGLSIVRSIALAHRGTVSASASAHGGLCLCVRLPLQADRALA
jgi:two-component system, OmpR family, sensor histidine kinase BaeS